MLLCKNRGAVAEDWVEIMRVRQIDQRTCEVSVNGGRCSWPYMPMHRPQQQTRGLWRQVRALADDGSWVTTGEQLDEHLWNVLIALLERCAAGLPNSASISLITWKRMGIRKVRKSSGGNINDLGQRRLDIRPVPSAITQYFAQLLRSNAMRCAGTGAGDLHLVSNRHLRRNSRNHLSFALI